MSAAVTCSRPQRPARWPTTCYRRVGDRQAVTVTGAVPDYGVTVGAALAAVPVGGHQLEQVGASVREAVEPFHPVGDPGDAIPHLRLGQVPQQRDRAPWPRRVSRNDALAAVAARLVAAAGAATQPRRFARRGLTVRRACSRSSGLDRLPVEGVVGEQRVDVLIAHRAGRPVEDQILPVAAPAATSTNGDSAGELAE
jgi:hypothetical protein